MMLILHININVDRLLVTSNISAVGIRLFEVIYLHGVVVVVVFVAILLSARFKCVCF